MFQSIRSILFSWQILLRLCIAFLIPFFFLSGMMTIAAENINQILGETENKARVGLVGKAHTPKTLLKEFQDKTILTNLEQERDLLSLLDEDSLDIGILFSSAFNTDSSGKKVISVYYNSVQYSSATQDAFDILEAYEQALVFQKIEAMGLNTEIVDPVTIEKNNTFNAFATLGKIMTNIRGTISSILNFLFILFVIWLTRILVLRACYKAPKNFFINVSLVFLSTMLGTGLVFVGFQSGLGAEQIGMIRSIVLSIQQLLVWNKLSSILWLWWPTWLFIIGLLGCIAASSKSIIATYTRTFWTTIAIHGIALYGLIPIEKMSAIDPFIPILNVFRVGQLALKGTLETSSWTISMLVSTLAALLLLLLWKILAQRAGQETENQA
ncbi:MAG: Unknown protein [uncultured Aureispira sp.]|uniref:ABC transporter permease n=1 Tax=uncultured Aureispira sp. TaxID=1331704 RepID=A0A6S6TEW9_9BACT|nr:MAG: Unknown protein [uncultured Aureispira sp.]